MEVQIEIYKLERKAIKMDCYRINKLLWRARSEKDFTGEIIDGDYSVKCVAGRCQVFNNLQYCGFSPTCLRFTAWIHSCRNLVSHKS